MAAIYAVIMAGGKGERFWPISNSRRPKQFLPLVGGEPMLTQSLARLSGLVEPERIFVITSAAHAETARQCAPGIPAANIIAEPVGRDTAAAVALGAGLVRRQDPAGVFVVLTADHVIGPRDVFQRTLADCVDVAAGHEVLVTIGIVPHEASTGYGYIETGDAFEYGTRILRAKRFVEKPDSETARRYISAGNYYWNSGMFVWSAATITAAMKRYRPQLSPLIESVASGGEPEKVMAELYPGLEKISIDYAVMEKADNVLTALAEFDWDDVGSWPALARHLEADEQGNVVVGEAVFHDAGGNIVHSNGRLTALVGVNDLVVAQGERVTLICPRERAQEVKQLVERLLREGGYEDVL